MTAEVSTSIGSTDRFEMKKGVKQGDPLAPILFIIAINPILEWINSFLPRKSIKSARKDVIQSWKNQLMFQVLGFVDDLLLVATDRHTIEFLLRMLLLAIDSLGMKINAQKSAYTYLADKQYEPPRIREADGSEQAVTFIESHQTYPYLGFHINLQLDWQDQHEKLVAAHRRTLNIFKKKKFSLKKRVQLVNVLANTKSAYRMQLILFPDEILKELNMINYNVIAGKYGAKLGKFSERKFSILCDKNVCKLDDMRLLNERCFYSTLARIMNGRNTKVSNKIARRIHVNAIMGTNDDNAWVGSITNPKYAKDITLRCDIFDRLGLDEMNSKIEDNIMSNWKNVPLNEATVKDNMDLLKWFHNKDIHRIGDLISVPWYEEHQREDLDCSDLTPHSIWYTTVCTLGAWKKHKNEFEQFLKSSACDINVNKKTIFRMISKKQMLNGFINQRSVPQIAPMSESTFRKTVNVDLLTVYLRVVFTDGSLNENGQAGYGVYFGEGNPILNQCYRTMNEQSVLNSELQAILCALMSVPLEYQLMIIVDSASAIQIIKRGTKEKPHKVCNRFTVRAIEDILQQRATVKGEVKFVHIYSHQAEKLEKDLDVWGKKIEEQRTILGDELFELAKSGNEIVDKMARVGANIMVENGMLKAIVPTVDRVNFDVNNKYYHDSDLTKLLKGKHEEALDVKIYKLSRNLKDRPPHCKLIDETLSNALMRRTNTTKYGPLQSFQTKLRIGALLTADKLVHWYENEDDVSQNIFHFYKRKLFHRIYATNECHYCKQLGNSNKETMHHVFIQCPLHTDLRRALDVMINYKLQRLNTTTAMVSELSPLGEEIIQHSNIGILDEVIKEEEPLKRIHLFQGYVSATALIKLKEKGLTKGKTPIQIKRTMKKIALLFVKCAKQMWKMRCDWNRKHIEEYATIEKARTLKAELKVIPENIRREYDKIQARNAKEERVKNVLMDPRKNRNKMGSGFIGTSTSIFIRKEKELILRRGKEERKRKRQFDRMEAKKQLRIEEIAKKCAKKELKLKDEKERKRKERELKEDDRAGESGSAQSKKRKKMEMVIAGDNTERKERLERRQLRKSSQIGKKYRRRNHNECSISVEEKTSDFNGRQVIEISSDQYDATKLTNYKDKYLRKPNEDMNNNDKDMEK